MPRKSPKTIRKAVAKKGPAPRFQVRKAAKKAAKKATAKTR